MKKCRYYKIVRQGFFLGQTVTAAQGCLEKECAERLLQHVAGNNVNFTSFNGLALPLHTCTISLHLVTLHTLRNYDFRLSIP